MPELPRRWVFTAALKQRAAALEKGIDAPLFVAERLHGIDAGGATRGQVTGEKRNYD